MGYWGIATGVMELPDGAVITCKLADGAVTDAKIASGAVTEARVASGAITVDKIGSGAVTGVKIASGAVTEAKVASSAITGAKIANGAVTDTKIANAAVTGLKIATGAINSSHLQDWPWSWPQNVWVNHFGGRLNLDCGTNLCINDGVLYVGSCSTAYLCGMNYLRGAEFASGYPVCLNGGFTAQCRACFGGSLVLPNYGNACDGNGQLRWCTCASKVEVYCNGSWYALH